jgi:hypothetical protein
MSIIITILTDVTPTLDLLLCFGGKYCFHFHGTLSFIGVTYLKKCNFHCLFCTREVLGWNLVKRIENARIYS